MYDHLSHEGDKKISIKNKINKCGKTVTLIAFTCVLYDARRFDDDDDDDDDNGARAAKAARPRDVRSLLFRPERDGGRGHRGKNINIEITTTTTITRPEGCGPRRREKRGEKTGTLCKLKRPTLRVQTD